MNNDPDNPSKALQWQLSLKTILAFVFAVALWFMLATQAPQQIPILTMLMISLGMIASLLLWIRKWKGILALLLLFEMIVVATTVVPAVARAATSRDYHAKNRVLRSLASGMSVYAMKWDGVPPPPADAKLHGKLLHDFLASPFMISNNHIPPTLSGKLVGATGNSLKWERHGSDRFILIDMGEDGVAGKYTYDGKTIQKIPVDANQDGVDDGIDDHAVGQTWKVIE